VSSLITSLNQERVWLLVIPHGGEQDCTVPPQGVAVVRLQHSAHETSWKEPPNLVHQACGSRSASPINNWHGVALLACSRREVYTK
jgi:hypothetical protein